ESRDELADPQDLIKREIMHALPALRTLPEHAETIAAQVRAGRLTVRTERYAGSDRTVVDQWVDRVLVAAIGAAGALASGVLLVAGSLSDVVGVRDTLWALGFSGLTFGLVLLMRSAAQSLHRLPVRSDRGGTPSPGCSQRPRLDAARGRRSCRLRLRRRHHAARVQVSAERAAQGLRLALYACRSAQAALTPPPRLVVLAAGDHEPG